MDLLELPNEMLQYIASFLDAESLSYFGGTCKDLKYIADIESLWQALCQKDFKVSSNKGWGITYKKMYTKILVECPILGFQRIAHQPFGGLLSVVWSEGEIRASCVYPGMNPKDDLEYQSAYSLTWDKTKDCLVVECTHSLIGYIAPALLTKSGKFYVLQCAEDTCFILNHQRMQCYAGQTDKHVTAGFKDFPEAFKTFDKSIGFSYPLLPLRFPATPSHFPVTPGVYKASYGCHGIEIIQVRACSDNPMVMECMKITGDPNVPAGVPSLLVFLDKPIILSLETQADCDSINEMDDCRTLDAYALLLQDEKKRDWQQPFCLPYGFARRGNNIPTTCQARYIAQGTVADHYFTSPSTSRAHVVKFDNDNFGVIWLDLDCFMLMTREKTI